MAINSRKTKFLAGAKKGAKLGAYTAFGFISLLSTAGLYVMFFVTYEYQEAFGSIESALKSIVGMFAGIGLAMFYGAIAGGLILGSLCALRPNNRQ